jgi:hypothetical protein
LLTLYDPAQLRVTAAVPQSALPAGAKPEDVRVELAGQGAQTTPQRVQVLPTGPRHAHGAGARRPAPGLAGARPGLFARLWLPGAPGAGEGARITVPQSAVVRRAELTGLYVLGAGGQPQLRQVRLGRAEGGRVEVLSGVAAGEAVLTEPQTAARAR